MKLPRFRYEPPPVYFMHIPKTAGQALRLLFNAAYPAQTIVQIYRQGTHRFAANELERFRCISSHWGPGLLPLLAQPGLARVTLLRNPVEQFVSHLYFRQAELTRHPQLFEASYLEQMQPLLQADLRTLLTATPTMIPDNPQTRCLGGIEDVRPYFKAEASEQRAQVLHALPFAFSTTREIGLLAACAHQQLEQMAVVGITERFAESSMLLCDLLGIPMPVQLPIKNIGSQKREVAVHGYRSSLSADLLDLVMAKTKVDQELYDHACELFALQLAHRRTRLHRTFSIAPRLRPLAQRVKMKGRGVATKVTSHMHRILPTK